MGERPSDRPATPGSAGHAPAPAPPPAEARLRRRIVDAAVNLAATGSWEALRLADVAGHLGCSLDDLRLHFREKEEIVDAWLDRADAAMLQAADADPAQDQLLRFENAVIAWLAALQPHHRVTRQMIAGKLEPGHLHVQLPAVLRISRTVQWLREASGRRHAFLGRALDESLLTAAFVATFSHWLADRAGGDLRRSRRFLGRILRTLERVGGLPGLGRLAGGGPPSSP